MPRKRRIAIQGEVHHIISRGFEGINIFIDDRDRTHFLTILNKVLSQSSCRCYAWVLMNNHYHLVVRPLGVRLGEIMRRLNGSYARYFNLRYQRRGYLFQDRYKSLATQEFWYFRELIRYVHLNPLRAGLVKSVSSLEQYLWSGHRALIGRENVPWQAVKETLEKFDRNPQNSLKSYLRFLEDGVESGYSKRGLQLTHTDQRDDRDVSENEVHDDRIIGEADFVRRAVALVEKERRLKQERIKARPSLEKLLSIVSKENKINSKEIFVRGYCDIRSETRAEFCRAAFIDFGYTVREIACFLGLNPGTVSRMVRRARLHN